MSQSRRDLHRLSILAVRDNQVAIGAAVIAGGTLQKSIFGGMSGAVQESKGSMIRADKMTAAPQASQVERERRRPAMEQHTRNFDASIGGVTASPDPE
jgi:hypothetical protein